MRKREAKEKKSFWKRWMKTHVKDAFWFTFAVVLGSYMPISLFHDKKKERIER